MSRAITVQDRQPRHGQAHRRAVFLLAVLVAVYFVEPTQEHHLRNRGWGEADERSWPSFAVDHGSRVELGREVVRVLHETPERYARLEILERDTLDLRCSLRLGDAHRLDVVLPRLWLVWAEENASNYGGLFVVDGSTCEQVDAIRNPGALVPRLLGNRLLVFADEDSNGFGGVAVYSFRPKVEKLNRVRTGNPVSVRQELGLLLLTTEENQSNHGGMVVLRPENGQQVGRTLRNPGAIAPLRVSHLLFLAAWEDSSSSGGVAVLDLARGEQAHFHRAGDPYRLALEGDRVVASCDENASFNAGDLVLDARSGERVKYLER